VLVHLLAYLQPIQIALAIDACMFSFFPYGCADF